MSYSNIQILPDGNLLIKSGSDLSNNVGSISDFLKSKDYDVIQIFQYTPSNVEYFQNPNNHKYHIVYSLDYPDRCWKIWDTQIHKLYKVVSGEGDSVTLERLPFHVNYYKVRIADDIFFHQKEQSDLRDIKIKKLLE